MTYRLNAAPRLLALVLLATLAPGAALQSFAAETGAANRLPRLFIVGDSTVKNTTAGQAGWGDFLGPAFDSDRIEIQNHAIGGRSSRTFQTEGRWESVLKASRPGDFVLIQLGHNDSGPLDDRRRARGSLPGVGEGTREIDNPVTKRKETVHTYGWYLRKYIADARAQGMTPIVVSPIPHCPARQVRVGDVEDNRHVAWSRQVAGDEGVAFLDLNALVMNYYATLTPAEIKRDLFTPADNTHTSEKGAGVNAVGVVQGLRALGDCELKDFLRPADATAGE